MAGKPWTPQEERRLKRLYLSEGFGVAARGMPGRTRAAVGKRLWEMGLTLTDTPHGVKGRLVFAPEAALALNVTEQCARKWINAHPDVVKRGLFRAVTVAALQEEVARRAAVPQTPLPGYVDYQQVLHMVGSKTRAECVRKAAGRGRVRSHIYRPPGERHRLAYSSDDVADWRLRVQRRKA